jgi:hypothetical protein
MKKCQPKQLDSIEHRQVARNIRNTQWRFMERCLECNPLWWCIWNKKRMPELEDEWRSGLLDGMELMEWIDAHRRWFRIGKWNDTRYARPVRLSPPGRVALEHRHLYDLEPVTGGLVEPGWESIPLPLNTAPQAIEDA